LIWNRTQSVAATLGSRLASDLLQVVANFLIECHGTSLARFGHAINGPMRHVLFTVALAGLAACDPTFTYTRSSRATYPAKPAKCQLEVFTVPPQRAFVELGTFEIENHGGGKHVGSLSELRELVQARACAAGADALLGRKAGDRYIQATALRWEEGSTEP
jgi:hypothetical protein